MLMRSLGGFDAATACSTASQSNSLSCCACCCYVAVLLLLLLQVTIVTQGTNHGWPQFEGSLYNKANYCGNNPPPGSYKPPTFEVRLNSISTL
jgi:hypothetical protein